MSNIRISRPAAQNPTGLTPVAGYNKPATNTIGDFARKQGITFTGQQDALGKGYGKAATKQVLDYAFVRLKLNRVYLTVFSDNISAIKAYETSGFQFEGCLKQDFLRYDGFADVTVMGITKDIFENTKKRTENI